MVAMLAERPALDAEVPVDPNEVFTWLVEEHTTGWSGGNEEIPFRVLVKAKTPQSAFETANQYSRMTRRVTWKDLNLEPEPVGLAFSPDELVEVVPQYLWQAADGSSVFYEVRRLPSLIIR